MIFFLICLVVVAASGGFAQLPAAVLQFANRRHDAFPLSHVSPTR